MKKILWLFLIINVFVSGQTVYQDYLLDNSIYKNAPEETRNRKPFIREWKFFDDRAFPDGFIPKDAYVNAVKQRDELRNANAEKMHNISWVSLGPTSGYYFSWGNVSSRMVTGVYNYLNPDIIYVGPANGGVWKSTNGGINWQPLTDYQPSLSMGCIVLDPINPDIIYAGTGEATYSGASYYGAGLLKSTDAGATWMHITAGLPAQTYFSRIAIRPGHNNELLAALGNAGLYRSTDYGITWNFHFLGRCDDVIFSQSGDTSFIVGSGTGLKRSTDGGVNFSSFSTGLISGVRTHFDYCKQSPNVMYASVHITDAVQVFKSTDYGITWNRCAPSYTFSGGGQAWYDLYCRVHPQNPNIAFIGIIDIFKTTDGGNSFSNITNGYSGGDVHVDQHNMFFHPNDPSTLIALNDGGIYKSTNSGSSFINLNQDLTLTQFYRITANPTTPSHILGGTQDNGTQQTYSSINWTAAFGGDGGEVSFNPFNTSYILGESQNGYLNRSSNGGANWTNAMNGISTSETGAWVAPIAAHPSENGVFFCARQRVYKTTNNGANWTAVSGQLNGSSAVRELDISHSNPSVMFASSSSKIFKSKDAGATWTNMTTLGLPARTITSVRINPSDPDFVIITFSGFGTAKVYKTTDGGSTWSSIHGNLPNSPVNDVVIYTEDIAGPNNTYFVGTDVGVFVTRDGGANWIELFDGLPNTVVTHLDYNRMSRMLRAGTHGRGVYEAFIDYYTPVELVSFNAVAANNFVNLNWKTATELNNRGFEIERKLKNEDWRVIGFVKGNGTVTTENSYSFIDDFSEIQYEGRVLYRLKQLDFDGTYEYSKILTADVNFIPGGITLYQNYPNPFNPVTNIAFSIPVTSNVKLKIFNQLGQLVTTLTDKQYSPGIYNFMWDASFKSSGVYYCSLEVTDSEGKNTTQTKKLTVLK